MSENAIDRPWWTMRLTYGLVPIVAGADKFTNLLTDWKKYLSPLATRVVPVSQSNFMRGVGVIEILAGALVLNRRTTRLGAYVVGAWLGAIAVNLFSKRSHYDVAVRDIVMGIGAITLAKLTEARTVQRDVPTKSAAPTAVEPVQQETFERRASQPLA